MNTLTNNFFIKKLSNLDNKKGNIIKIINKNDKNFNEFGELYISEIHKNEIKAWKYHSKNDLNIYVIEGKIKFVLAITKGKKIIFNELVIHNQSNTLLNIPKKTWFGFMGINKVNKLLSLSSSIFSENEIHRKKINNFKYSWV